MAAIASIKRIKSSAGASLARLVSMNERTGKYWIHGVLRPIFILPAGWACVRFLYGLPDL